MIHNKQPSSVNKTKINMVRKFCLRSLYPILLITLSGCSIFNDQPRPIKWETKAERISTPIDIKFKRGSATISTPTKNAIRANIATPHETYFRLYGNNSSAARINNVMGYLDALGVPRSNIDIFRQSNDVAISPNTLTLIIDHYQIIPPKCLGWQRQRMNPSVPPTGEINFRCTNERNFAAMIADPRVIISGNALAGTDANRSNKSIDNYQADTVKKIKVEKIENSNAG